GERASALSADAFDEQSAASAWRTLDDLHAAHIAHLDVSPRSLAVRDDGTVGLTDFTDAVVPAVDDAMRADGSPLLGTRAPLVGPERGVATAQAALNRDRIGALLPFLQAAALPHDLRAAAKAAHLDVDALRGALAESAKLEAPKLAPLRRISWATLLQTG